MDNATKLKVQLPSGAIYYITEITETDLVVSLYPQRAIDFNPKNLSAAKRIQPNLSYSAG